MPSPRLFESHAAIYADCDDPSLVDRDDLLPPDLRIENFGAHMVSKKSLLVCSANANVWCYPPSLSQDEFCG